jgi:tetratricopeptide (TPR) repeat protein
LILPIFLLSQPVFCEELVLNLGNHLFKQGEYTAAITEYKRYLYFNQDSEKKTDVLMRIARAFREEGDLSEARYYYLKAQDTAKNTEELADARMETAFISILAGEYTRAEFELLQLSSIPDLAKKTEQKIAFRLGIVYTFTGTWDKAHKEFSFALSDQKKTMSQIESILEEAAAVKKKKPTTAKVLSTVLPGLGQVYAGYPLDGLGALLINGGIFFLFGHTIADGHYPEAALTFLYLVLRFYPGNIYQAGQKAKAYNNRQEEMYRNRILRVLEEVVSEP